MWECAGLFAYPSLLQGNLRAWFCMRIHCSPLLYTSSSVSKPFLKLEIWLPGQASIFEKKITFFFSWSSWSTGNRNIPVMSFQCQGTQTAPKKRGPKGYHQTWGLLTFLVMKKRKLVLEVEWRSPVGNQRRSWMMHSQGQPWRIMTLKAFKSLHGVWTKYPKQMVSSESLFKFIHHHGQSWTYWVFKDIQFNLQRSTHLSGIWGFSSGVCCEHPQMASRALMNEANALCT